MDGDSIGILTATLVVLGGITAGVLWARARGQVRRKAVVAVTQALGFRALKDNQPPEYFPLKSFPVMRWGEKMPWGEKSSRIFSMAATGTRGRREVLFFDYFLLQSSGRMLTHIVAQTFIAARGGSDCFPSASSDPALKLESAEDWTVAYRHKKILTADDIQALILAIPAKP